MSTETYSHKLSYTPDDDEPLFNPGNPVELPAILIFLGLSGCCAYVLLQVSFSHEPLDFLQIADRLLFNTLWFSAPLVSALAFISFRRGREYIAKKTREVDESISNILARDIGLVPCTTPLESPQSN